MVLWHFFIIFAVVAPVWRAWSYIIAGRYAARHWTALLAALPALGVSPDAVDRLKREERPGLFPMYHRQLWGTAAAQQLGLLPMRVLCMPFVGFLFSVTLLVLVVGMYIVYGVAVGLASSLALFIYARLVGMVLRGQLESMRPASADGREAHATEEGARLAAVESDRS